MKRIAYLLYPLLILFGIMTAVIMVTAILAFLR